MIYAIQVFNDQPSSKRVLHNMESIQEQLIDEINKTPDSLLQEILDFVMFVNRKYRQRQPRKTKSWQPGFFEEVLGGWEGEKLVRDWHQTDKLRSCEQNAD
jgi:Protein of unknown function (DUF2281)